MECFIIDKNGNMIDKINVNRKKHSISDEKFKKAGEGVEVKVYKRKKEVYKIIKTSPFMRTMNRTTAEYLEDIETKRILLPENLIIDASGDLIGTTSSFIKKDGKKSILDLDKKSFITELSLIEKDLDLLTSKKIVVRDLHSKNVIYNGQLFFVDYGSYAKEEDMILYDEPLDLINKKNLTVCLLDDILMPKITTEFSSIKKAGEFFPQYNIEKETLTDYFDSLIGNKKNLREKVLEKK